MHIGVNSGCGSICNLLDMDLQMPGRGWKHLQLAGIEFADACPGVGSICNLLDMNLQMPGRGAEVSAICWYWICRCLVRVGSICNLLDMNLQMPGRGWKHPQLAGYEFADAWSGSEASATCWIWICRCLVGVGSICNLLVLDL